MRSGKLSLSVYSLLAVVLGGGFSGACSLTATRPVQDMSNAEIAIKAAKDLNADSLVPEIYRSAIDHYFKAKRDYRLKNFDKAKKHAQHATRLAEQAEFEAYRLGGATPEASQKFSAPEGSMPDDSGFRESQEGPGGSAGPAPLLLAQLSLPAGKNDTFGNQNPASAGVPTTGGTGAGAFQQAPSDTLTNTGNRTAPTLQQGNLPTSSGDRELRESRGVPGVGGSNLPNSGIGGLPENAPAVGLPPTRGGVPAGAPQDPVPEVKDPKYVRDLRGWQNNKNPGRGGGIPEIKPSEANDLGAIQAPMKDLGSVNEPSDDGLAAVSDNGLNLLEPTEAERLGEESKTNEDEGSATKESASGAANAAKKPSRTPREETW